MHDYLVAASFIAMVLTPAIVATNAARDPAAQRIAVRAVRSLARKRTPEQPLPNTLRSFGK